MKVKIISRDAISQCLSMAEAIAAVKEAYLELSLGKALLPQRIQVPVEKQEGVSLFMPAYLAESESLGVKIVSVFPRNTGQGLPTIHSLVVLLEAGTGRPQAILEGASLTALRTGAASGLATDLLARKEAPVAAIFGAGTQGRTQLEAIAAVRNLARVWVYDLDEEAASAFVEEFRKKTPSLALSLARSPSQAVREADIICTATTSQTPVFEDKDIRHGTHINGIGSYTPRMQEIPAQTVARAKIVVDFREACLKEAGDLVLPLQEGLITQDQIHGEIGEVASGLVPGRESEEEITFFKSVGVAVQDLAVARHVLKKAQEQGLGSEVEI